MISDEGFLRAIAEAPELWWERGRTLALVNLAALRTENDSAEMLKALAPLQRLTSRGVSVLLCHYPRKERSPAGQSARGSGALSACAGILLEMHPVNRRNPKDCCRRLRG